jgi:uncharacterized protein (DUF488 family)
VYTSFTGEKAITMSDVIYTIGHSTHPLEQFLALLREHRIEVLVDVRSQPYSRFAPQFNREVLGPAVEQAGFKYRHLGDTLGGRPADERAYRPDGSADYQKMAKLPAYREGLALLERGSRFHRLAVMCSEGNPLACHRHQLLARTLVEDGWRVVHILRDGRLQEVTPADFAEFQLALTVGI